MKTTEDKPSTPSEMGRKGGMVRSERLSKKRKLEIAMMGVLARRKKAKDKK